MKRIGIITITGLGNYGNRLQNYALQQTLEALIDCRCETFVNRSCGMKGYISRLLRPKKTELSEREMCFQRFNDDYMHFSDIQINNFSKNRRLLQYDCLVCGSDQIWNSDYPENDRANFGYFFKNQKVISYAASFGTNTVSTAKQDRYAKYLKHMKAISVREEKGREIAARLSGRDDVYVHVDPTMLLNREQWEAIEKRPKMYNGGKFILKYFLGEKNLELECELEDYARKHDLQVIDVITKDSPYYGIGPLEFLYLEHNAEQIVTDSFHSCVFAIIFERPFAIACRKMSRHQDMGSRVDTLLDLFDMQNRRLQTGNMEEIFGKNISYSNVKNILEIEKEKSFHFLNENVLY